MAEPIVPHWCFVVQYAAFIPKHRKL